MLVAILDAELTSERWQSVQTDPFYILSPRNRLYEIAPQFLADKANRLLDFGWCLLRMNVGSQVLPAGVLPRYEWQLFSV